jgi:hypothetical protein
MKREDLAVTYLVVVGLEAIFAFLFGVLEQQPDLAGYCGFGLRRSPL